MTAQIFLVLPTDGDITACMQKFDEALAAARVAAALVPRGQRSEGSYKALVKAVAPRAQAASASKASAKASTKGSAEEKPKTTRKPRATKAKAEKPAEE